MTSPAQAQAEPVSVTLLHTNDIHSHFRGENTPLGLGGVARLKTAIDQIRTSVDHSLLIDGGDWSEGNVYYMEGAGRETLRMMDFMGYDAAVVGNHDWLNGPDTLLDLVQQANPSLSLLAANIQTTHFDRETEFRRRIPPYVIKNIGGVKIAFIGVITYEFIYDHYFKPIKIVEPFGVTRDLAKALKKQVDAVIVISHNRIKTNRAILLAAPDVDLVIGGHDHAKLNQPIVVTRPGHPAAWIVEAGSWGRYLGRVDLRITPRDLTRPDSPPQVELVQGRLLQMDASIKENPDVLERITTLEALIETNHGPIFHDHVGDSEIELSRNGLEHLMGDFSTDAYRQATRADLSIDHTNFIANEIHRGAVRSVDVFNGNPQVYNLSTQKAWTLHIVPISGRALNWILNLLYSSKAFSEGGLSFSGAEIVFNPLFNKSSAPDLASVSPELFGLTLPEDRAEGLSIRSIKIGGQDLQNDRVYQLAAPGGIVQAVEFMNSILPGAVPLDHMIDTGVEDWRVIADSIRAMSPVTLNKISFGNRIHTAQPDLGVLSEEVSWIPQRIEPNGTVKSAIHARVRNIGQSSSPAGTASSGPRVELVINQNGVNYAIDSVNQNVGLAQPVPALASGEVYDFFWSDVEIPLTLGIYALTTQLVGTENELDHANDSVTQYFTADELKKQLHPLPRQ